MIVISKFTKEGVYKVKEIELKEIQFIDEESYQQIKKSMCKNNDYFTEEEIKKLA